MEQRTLQTTWTNEGSRLVGSIPYNAPATIFEKGKRFSEVIKPGAFSRALHSGGDVLATFNHDPSALLGRVSAGTLKLSDSPAGLNFSIDLDPSIERHKELATLIKRGDVQGASFTFGVRQGGETWNQDRTVRELTDLFLSELGPVTTPAYQQSTVAMRSGIDLKRKRVDLAEKI